MNDPATLDHTGIRARVPHGAGMCLLHAMPAWAADRIECTATSHRDADNPLRSGGTLPAPCAIEYAAQAMALHGSLCADEGAAPTPGFLASVRSVNLHVLRLDDVAGALHISARRMAGDTRQALYAFTVHDERCTLLVDGRATVILGALPGASAP
jgi:predicted hotdog family 3-hydroxylacyl-ACP dehydratase